MSEEQLLKDLIEMYGQYEREIQHRNEDAFRFQIRKNYLSECMKRMQDEFGINF